jgi:hypothetical protein
LFKRGVGVCSSLFYYTEGILTKEIIMKKLFVAIMMMCGLCEMANAQNVVNYGYGPVVVQVQPVFVAPAPIVVYKPVVVYQPVGVLVPVVPAPVWYPIVPEVRRPCWNWFHVQRPTYYYYHQ